MDPSVRRTPEPAGATKIRSRARPGDPAWPSAATWEKLNQDVGGQLLKPESPFAHCGAMPLSAACSEALAQLKNPYFIGDQPALTQTSGWVDAWTLQSSVYAVAARGTADIVAAVNFAREHDLRLVVKGGGHSYQGTSNAPDSLLVWTRRMNDVAMHDDFVAQGCEGMQAPQPAVTVGAGAMWSDAYNAVTTQGGRYVQGGGCTTVGVAGLVQSGGFGSFSKNYGTAAAGLLEAEIVTADGEVRIANACTNPDLFWGIKGGGGGSLGVVTRLTLRTRELPETFGGMFGRDQGIVGRCLSGIDRKGRGLLPERPFQSPLGRTDRLHVGHREYFDGVPGPEPAAGRGDLGALHRLGWRAQGIFLRKAAQRPGAAGQEFLGSGILQASTRREYWLRMIDRVRPQPTWCGRATRSRWAGSSTAIKSAWMPASLLRKDRQSQLVDALFASTRHWDVGVHFNKGLAGAPADEIDAARNTATNPDALERLRAGHHRRQRFAHLCRLAWRQFRRRHRTCSCQPHRKGDD